MEAEHQRPCAEFEIMEVDTVGEHVAGTKFQSGTLQTLAMLADHCGAPEQAERYYRGALKETGGSD